jgi:hypothetical protein
MAAKNKVLIEVDAKDSTAPTLRNLNNNLKKTAEHGKKVDKQFRMIRGGMGQMGHQVQDVAVMLQSGQNPLIILGQQGSQVASLFGPQGAVIGAFLAVGAAIGTSMLPAFFKASEATKELKEANEDLISSFDDLGKAQKAYAKTMAAKKILEHQEAIDELNETDRRRGVTLAKGFLAQREYNESLEDYQERIQKLDSDLAFHQKRIDEITSATDGTTGETEKLIESLTAEAAALGKTKDEVTRLSQAYINATPANQAIIDQQLEKIAHYDEIVAGIEAEQKALDKAAKETEKRNKDYQKGEERLRDFFFKENARKEASDIKRANDEKEREQDLYAFFQKLNDKKIADEKRVQDAITNLKLASIDMASNTVGQLADIAKEGSAEAKVLFAMQKALAIAQILVSTEQAAIAAGAQSAAIGGVIGFLSSAATIKAMGYASAGIVAGQTLASFEGGGLTGSGVRSGGMDGKGGRLAMVHPNEKITDLHKGQARSGNVSVSFNIQANDTRGFDELLQSRRGQIVSMINRAINDRGRSSLA